MGFLRRHYKIILALALLVSGSIAVMHYLSYNYAYIKIRDDSLNQFLGPKSAPITLIEVIDYRCPVCRAVDPQVQEFIARHDDIRVLHKHYPTYGDQSVFEAQIALAAGAMGKYKQVHNYLIRNDSPMTPQAVEEMGTLLNIDLDQLYEIMNSEKIHDAIAASAMSVVRYGVKNTPAFIINDKVHEVTGPPPTADDFEILFKNHAHTDTDAPE